MQFVGVGVEFLIRFELIRVDSILTSLACDWGLVYTI